LFLRSKSEGTGSQTFYNVNFISDIFTNVVGDTIFLKFFKRN
jgi:hypothetical protein